MTKEQEARAQEEYNAILRWWIDEEDKREQELKAAGKWIGGLGNNDDFSDISKEAREKMRKLAEKYGMPFDTKADDC